MSDELTFAEAMAMPPDEVEVQCQEEHCWSPLSAREGMALAHARTLKFRRARPKRSRVQEWARTNSIAGLPSSDVREECYLFAIRAVCEWLRSKPTDLHEFKDVAPYIEREFLGPR